MLAFRNWNTRIRHIYVDYTNAHIKYTRINVFLNFFKDNLTGTSLTIQDANY